jgi:hypothetical protein
VEEADVDYAMGDQLPPELAARAMQLLVRPEAARLSREGPNQVDLEIERCSFRGDHNQLDARHKSGVRLTFSFSAGVDLPIVGKTITLSLDPKALTLLGGGSRP